MNPQLFIHRMEEWDAAEVEASLAEREAEMAALNGRPQSEIDAFKAIAELRRSSANSLHDSIHRLATDEWDATEPMPLRPEKE